MGKYDPVPNRDTITSQHISVISKMLMTENIMKHECTGEQRLLPSTK